MAKASIIVLILMSSTAMAEQVNPKDVEVGDGDTVVYKSNSYRLIGMDTPEFYNRWRRVKLSEKRHALKAADRLIELMNNATIVNLLEVPCNCAPGTYGTYKCNYGRKCGAILVDGKNVTGILISEGLARSDVCDQFRCIKGPKTW